MNDAELYQRLIGNFVPPRVFDAHAHFYREQDVGGGRPCQSGSQPAVAGYDAWHSAQQTMMGRCAPRDGLFFAFPGTGMDIHAANGFVREQVCSRPDSRALMMVHPAMDPDSVDLGGRWAGFKVYHFFSGLAETQDSEIGQFLPDWAWEMAHKARAPIMLHVARRRSLADPANTDYIVARCRRYSDAKVILAHAGRGFAGHHTVEGIGRLRGLDNVFFDTSGICEPLALWHVLKTFGAGRLLYGSDYPASHWRGKAITIGDGFYWLLEHQIDWSDWIMGKPTLAGIESLHAIKQAAQMLDLRDTDIERIFYDNAVELLGLAAPDSACTAEDAVGTDRESASPVNGRAQ